MSAQNIRVSNECQNVRILDKAVKRTNGQRPGPAKMHRWCKEKTVQSEPRWEGRKSAKKKVEDKLDDMTASGRPLISDEFCEADITPSCGRNLWRLRGLVFVWAPR